MRHASGRVAGYCPMGCGQTLMVADAGRFLEVVCSRAACIRHHAAGEILAETETEHLVTVTRDAYSMKHPLRERLDNELLNCAAGIQVSRACGMGNVYPGVYRVFPKPDGSGHWTWEPTT